MRPVTDGCAAEACTGVVTVTVFDVRVSASHCAVATAVLVAFSVALSAVSSQWAPLLPA